MTDPARTVPPPARILGYAGLLPNLLLLGLALTRYGRVSYDGFAIGLGLSLAADLYAAVILSFLGGAWWGLAAPRVTGRALWGWLVMAVAPSLVAVAAFTAAGVLRPPLGIALVLGAGLVLSLLGDRRLARAGLAPAWWLRLRVPLSVGLAAETVATALLA